MKKKKKPIKKVIIHLPGDGFYKDDKWELDIKFESDSSNLKFSGVFSIELMSLFRCLLENKILVEFIEEEQ